MVNQRRRHPKKRQQTHGNRPTQRERESEKKTVLRSKRKGKEQIEKHCNFFVSSLRVCARRTEDETECNGSMWKRRCKQQQEHGHKCTVVLHTHEGKIKRQENEKKTNSTTVLRRQVKFKHTYKRRC